jgi:hypothetical protein
MYPSPSEKPTLIQAAQEFPTFYATRRFNTAFRKTRH